MAIQNKVERNTFGVEQLRFPVPNINAVQLESYKNFWDNELKKILKEFSPIIDPVSERWKVTFGPEYSLKQEGRTEREAIIRGGTFGSKLEIKITVENKLTKEKKTQKVFVGTVPTMTGRGSFVVNGTQKIVVGQLVKSPGALFKRKRVKGKYIYSGKIIPERGAWIEFYIDKNDVFYAKIDRKKKFPATQILRLFGMEKDADIIEAFKGIESDSDIDIIQSTFAKDTASSQNEAVSSIYQKLRPGDIIDVNKGREYLVNMFVDENKYNFGDVGRYKFDTRLKLKSEATKGFEYKKNLTLNEIIAVMREVIRMRLNNVESDSIDSLSNRRVRTVSEWLTKTFKVGMARVVRNTRDKMTNTDQESFTPSQLMNMRPLAAMIDDFFNTSQLSRFMDQTNVLSEMDTRQYLTATGPGGLTKERAGFDVRDVHPSHYGRLCPINTPEGPAFGLNVHLALYARINKMGFIETPYYKVKKSMIISDKSLVGRITEEEVLDSKGKKIIKKGQLITKNILEQVQSSKLDKNTEIKVKQFVSDEVVYLSANEELGCVISEKTKHIDDQGHFTTEFVSARRDGNPVQANSSEVDFVDVTPNQILSLSTCMVPFVAQSDSFRVLVATNQQGQALPLVKPENPIVATGFEEIVARDSGYMETAPCDGIVIKSDSIKVVVQDSKTNKKHEFSTIKYIPSNSHSAINQSTVVKEGQKVKKGDVLIEGFGIHNGEFAIGQNVRVAFMMHKGYNFEDAIILSERLLKNNKFTSTHVQELVCDVHETRLGKEEVTRDIPNIPVDKLSKLDETGIIHVGAYVESGDILVGKITPKGETDLTPEDKLIRVLFGEYSKDVKNSSLYLEHGLSGKIISVRELTRENEDPLPSDVIKRIHIWLATTRQIKIGDKMSGRHGNKGVVSTVMPEHDMPFTEDGKPIDVILNPMSVIGRMNLGQLLETHMGLIYESTGMKAVTQPLNEISAETIREELKQAGYDETGKVALYDGQTGEKYKRDVVVGNLYLNKLHHLVDEKWHTRSTGPYSLVTQQPLGGRSNMELLMHFKKC